MDLAELAAKHRTDKLKHGYCPAYESVLGPLRDQELTLLEIGVDQGGSLRMWEEWLPRAHIIGVDIDPASAKLEMPPRAQVIVADATEWLPSSPVDVIIDDGSHRAQDILVSFVNLWDYVVPGGWYFIEDLATQWIPEWGGGPGGSGVTELAAELMRLLMREAPGVKDMGGAIELRVWPQLLGIRRSPSDRAPAQQGVVGRA